MVLAALRDRCGWLYFLWCSSAAAMTWERLKLGMRCRGAPYVSERCLIARLRSATAVQLPWPNYAAKIDRHTRLKPNWPRTSARVLPSLMRPTRRVDASLRPPLAVSSAFHCEQKAPTKSDARRCAVAQRTRIALSPRRRARLARAAPRAALSTHLTAAPATNGSIGAAPGAPRPRRGPRKQNGSRVNTLLLGRTEERRTGRKDELGRPLRPGPHLHELVRRAGLETGGCVETGRLA